MSTGHEDGGWMNADQKDSHPEPFTFMDAFGRPYKAMRWGTPPEWWLFYWHKGQKSWVSLRPANHDDLRAARRVAIPAAEAKLYDDLSDKFNNRLSTPKE